MKIEKKQKLAKEWFMKLQNVICNIIEQLEKEYGSNIKFKKNKKDSNGLFKYRKNS